MFQLVFLSAVPARAEDFYYSTLYTPYPLEDFSRSPRAFSLGAAFTATGGDAACLFYNPAGLAGLRTPQLSLFHQAGIVDISQQNILAGFPVEKIGTFAFSAHYVNFGTLQGTDNAGDPTSSYNPMRLGLGIGWGKLITPWLSAGLSFRELFQTLSTGDQTFAFSVCAGAVARVQPNLWFGTSYSLLYSGYDPELGLWKVGLSWAPVLDRDNPTLLLVDASLPPGGVYRIQCGLEQSLFSVFYARLGHQWELADNKIDGLRGFTGGLGARFHDLILDCSFSPDGDLGGFRSIGLTYRFPQKGQASTPISFSPTADPSTADKVVEVQVQFDLPDTSGGGTPDAMTPEIQTLLDSLGTKVQQNPKDVQAWTQLGRLYWSVGQKEYTFQCFEEVLRLEPQNAAMRDWLEKAKAVKP